jgi:hypothetical protein
MIRNNAQENIKPGFEALHLLVDLRGGLLKKRILSPARCRAPMPGLQRPAILGPRALQDLDSIIEAIDEAVDSDQPPCWLSSRLGLSAESRKGSCGLGEIDAHGEPCQHARQHGCRRDGEKT